MECEQIAQLLPDYLQGDLGPDQQHNVEAHLKRCANCAEEVALWKKLSLLPVEQPSPGSRARFEAMLQAYRAGCSTAPKSNSRWGERSWNSLRWLRSPLGQVAWSAALLAVGFISGLYLANSRSRSQDLAALESELAGMKQMVVLSLLQQQSAGARLEGVTWSTRDQQLDPKLLSALLHTLRHDPSVDVRLAALDALSRHAGQPQVRTSVANALQDQQSPLVQVALIDQLVEWQDREAAPHIEKLRQSPNLNPTVRQRADWAIGKLN